VCLHFAEGSAQRLLERLKPKSFSAQVRGRRESDIRTFEEVKTSDPAKSANHKATSEGEKRDRAGRGGCKTEILMRKDVSRGGVGDAGERRPGGSYPIRRRRRQFFLIGEGLRRKLKERKERGLEFLSEKITSNQKSQGALGIRGEKKIPFLGVEEPTEKKNGSMDHAISQILGKRCRAQGEKGSPTYQEIVVEKKEEKRTDAIVSRKAGLPRVPL